MKKKIFFAVLVLMSAAIAGLLTAEQFKYDARGKRDPFVPLIGQDKSSAGSMPLAEISSIDEIVLEGIAGEAAGKRTAIMNGELVKENSRYGDIVVKKITKDSVLITVSGKEYTVNLPEEGGRKSE
ncbi:MAG: hypothetical protein PHI58_02565 [Candidatus Omnitrophica bacterium]|nr:hypothetical protein [Candidatus Omnitrophota bacterium]